MTARHTSAWAGTIARLSAALALAFLVLGLLSSAASAQLPAARPRTAQPGTPLERGQPPVVDEPGGLPPEIVQEDIQEDFADDDEDVTWMRGGRGMGLGLDRIDLTKEQRERIDQLRAQAHRDMIRARGDLAKARAELRAQAADPAATRAQIERAAGELQRVRDQLHDRRLKAHLDMREVLTPEQREELSARHLRAPFRGRGLGMRHGGAAIGPQMRRHIHRDVMRMRAPRAGERGRARGWGAGRAWF